MAKLVPSKNPKKESEFFSILAIVSGILSLIIGFLGIAAVAFGVRGAILSYRVNDKKHLTFSVIAVILGSVALTYYLMS